MHVVIHMDWYFNIVADARHFIVHDTSELAIIDSELLQSKKCHFLHDYIDVVRESLRSFCVTFKQL